ncbi:PIN domain-containing protein [Streptomyces sp. A3M-1-3]|uniref:PIN domain-containing protein n=1 Tax=Streptomyces sp. A3M-1-3 TaxID=2962044 RepID=UPI0020B77A9F|nr:PIN domain-containing protein [Streptomyces sp. A3M-1-3]MCP3822016.1 PIN domain-containing protein [Streptomyces sp. A3M-1-3]
MIQYLIDSSALWRLQRDKQMHAAWQEAVTSGAVGSCWPQRAEFRRSARDRREYDFMTDMFASLYPDVSVPKSAPQWVEATQHRLAQSGEHTALSAMDLLISATAAHHGVIVLHDDNDFTTVARAIRDVRERSVRNLPG